MKLKPDTTSYMQLCLNLDGQSPLYLMVPTYYDSTKKEWMGFVRLPNNKMIYGRGQTSKELEQNFNDSLRASLESEDADETFALFKPLSYWEEMNGNN